MASIEYELLCTEIGKKILDSMPMGDFNFEKMADQRAVKIIEEIQAVLHKHEQLTDFEIVDAIVDIFIKYHIDIGGCHDW